MSNRRLPLPGEKPSTIWQPRSRQNKRPHRLSWGALIGFVLIAAIAAGLWLWFSTGTPVTVVVNGQSVPLKTHSKDVAGAVRAAGVDPVDVAYAFPSLEIYLTEGMVITVGKRQPVIVHGDGMTKTVNTASISPEEIAAEAGFTLRSGDAIRVEREIKPSQDDIAVNPVLANAPSLPLEISVVRAATIIVDQNGQQVSFQTTARTLDEALDAAGYVLYEEDDITPPLDATIAANGLTVRIIPALPVTIRAEGREWIARTQQATVGGLLSELGLAPDSTDYLIPGPNAAVTAGMTVRLIRAHQETREERVPISFETVYVPDPDMELDQQREVQAGRAGTLSRQITIRVEDGVEVSRVVSSEWVEEQPQARVVAYGAKIVIRVLKTAEGSFKYWRKLRVLATSYSPSNASDKKPGDPRYGLSGTGAPMKRGVVAVDTRVISLGTYLYVPEYGTGRALDVGGAVKGLRIDLGYEDPLPRLWNEWTDLYLLLPIPPPDRIIWVIPAFTPPE